jgi:hypothetical protein
MWSYSQANSYISELSAMNVTKYVINLDTVLFKYPVQLFSLSFSL